MSRELGRRVGRNGPSFAPGWSWDAAGGQRGCCVPSPGIYLGWQPGQRDGVQSLILAFAKYTFCKKYTFCIIQFNPSAEMELKKKTHTTNYSNCIAVASPPPHAYKRWVPGKANPTGGPLCGLLGAAVSLAPALCEGFEGLSVPAEEGKGPWAPVSALWVGAEGERG